MSETASVLWISAGREDRGAASPRILGIPLIRRAVLAGERAGFDRILVEEEPGGPLAILLDGTRGEILPRGAAPGQLPPGRLVVLAPGVLPQARWLRSLLTARVEPGIFAADGRLAAFTDAEEPAKLLARLAVRGAAERPDEAVVRSLPVVPWPADPAGRVELASPADRPRVERWLLAGLVKDTEGFLSRHFERRISLAISRRLAATRVTPNAMTAVSVAVGLAGASFFLSPRPAFQFAGALLFLAHSILDGCDGELARLKFQESRLGGVLDFWGDNVVHCAVFGAIAIGWSREIGEPWPLAAGAAAILGTLLSAGLVFRETMSHEREGPLFTTVSRAPASRLSRAADALARRDFIYLVVILSAFGKAKWFLALAAVGAPLFFFVLVVLAAGAGRRSPNYS